MRASRCRRIAEAVVPLMALFAPRRALRSMADSMPSDDSQPQRSTSGLAFVWCLWSLHAGRRNR